MITSNEQDFNERPDCIANRRRNITPIERGAIKELFDNKQIIMKPADKDAAVVVMNRKDYQIQFYTKLDHNPNET